MTKKKTPQTPEPHELILDHLRALRTGQDRLEARFADLENRFQHTERQIAAMRRDMADAFEIMTDDSHRRKSLESRIERLERHAGLTDTLQQ